MGRKVTAAVGLVALLTAWAVLGAGPASATAVSTLYSSPTGSGTACTSASPCSLNTAKSQAEALAPAASGDIGVVLGGGTYPLASTLTFTAADSAANGHMVSYTAAVGADVVFSGGTPVPSSSWTIVDSSKQIYSAPLPSGALATTRQIYVNGSRAGIDTQNTSQVFGTMTMNADKTGYTYTASGPNSWTNTANVDLVYPAGQSQNEAWADSICPTASIGASTITMQNPCFALGTNGTTADPTTDTQVSLGTPAAVQNNYALLGQPGQFYIDPTASKIYYVPRAGETMNSATVVVPGLQNLLTVNGTTSSPVTNLTFKGIKFEYGTWTFGSQGVLDFQANDLFGSAANVDAMLPGNVTCHGCSNVTFSGDTFTHLGGAGLSFDGGGTNNTVVGNLFTDISSTGVQIGTGGGPNASEPTAIESGDVVNNNEVYDVAKEYLGGMGIFAGWVKNTTISHNEVWDTPYSGISLGWGWGIEPYTITMVNNAVDNNYVHDVMTSNLTDGGDIYLNGVQGSAGSEMKGNYIAGSDSQLYAALYLDNGSSYWNVANNVVGGDAPNWIQVQAGAPAAKNNTIQNNYVASTAGGIFPTSGIDPSNTIQNNNSGLTGWPSPAQASIGSAGLEPAFLSLDGGSPTSNLALNRTPTVSSSFAGHPATYSSDGNASTVWATANGDSSPSWQVDLGAAHPISDIQILFRTDGSPALSDTTNLKIVVSNSPNLTSGYTTACTTSPTISLPNASRFDCPAPSGTWRYVSLVKTDTTELVFSEIRVFGADTNVAQGQAAAASSVYTASYPASNAADGSTSTVWASANSGRNWWEVTLPSQYTLTQAQIVFRNDGFDYPTERENFAVWVSNNQDMSLGYTTACTVGANPLPYASTYACTLPPGPWQYVAVVKTDSNPSVLAEVRVLGH